MSQGSGRYPSAEVERGISEFGEVLADLVESTPGARGAVLSDGSGDAIDFAHRPSEITALDVQIAGAQVGQAMQKLQRSATIFGLGLADVVVEGQRATLFTSQLYSEYLLTVMLDHDCNIARIARRCAEVRATIRAMLE